MSAVRPLGAASRRIPVTCGDCGARWKVDPRRVLAAIHHCEEGYWLCVGPEQMRRWTAHPEQLEDLGPDTVAVFKALLREARITG